ncbi:MAG TPA: RNA polymerase-binding protein DksA, partial [Acidiferrobacteraceae bacterium]|nr:RNA polymerase-binding protein DksA [Acidiferrobacteraceae bacterium]HEX20576.1 RNA polymerase-binding protein DksA [Acidiferrobacteraceae bacterium]
MPAKKSKEITEELRHGVKPYTLKKGEKFMNKKQRTHFNLILSNWKEEIEEELERTVHHIQDEVLNLPDPTDRASQETDMSLELRSRDRERKLLKKINEAVERIESEEYGYCEKC